MTQNVAVESGAELNITRASDRRWKLPVGQPPYGSHDAGGFWHGGRYLGCLVAFALLGFYVFVIAQAVIYFFGIPGMVEVSPVLRWMLVAILFFYVMLMPYRLWLLASALRPEDEEETINAKAEAVRDTTPPQRFVINRYLVMVAIYKEEEAVIRTLIENLSKLKLRHNDHEFLRIGGKRYQAEIRDVDILILCESGEPRESHHPGQPPENTMDRSERAIRDFYAQWPANKPNPYHYKVMSIPRTSHEFADTILRSEPQTKPRALNYGLFRDWAADEEMIDRQPYTAQGEYCVIYDAEDRPEEDQLLKAVCGFGADPSLWCIQGRLSYENLRDTWITSLFKADYGSWFDLLLEGLGKQQLVVPLGGTSNHFRVEELRQVGGWDAFNVAEDCDLGMWISREGQNVNVLPSTTWEQADPGFNQWIRQRSRWMKGYMQTFFVHLRRPDITYRELGWKRFLSFLFIIGGTCFFPILNPLFWALTLFYVVSVLLLSLGVDVSRPLLEFVYDLQFTWAVPWATGSFFVSNLIYFIILYVGHRRHKKPGRTWHVVLLWPVYSAMLSIATIKALIEYVNKPFHWEKSKHTI
jgi:cellulose synthase/poly-beta-1,6-N-acetylglucosamine synthase-like glycosyltransferase